jgi:hypothetical protein
LYIFLSFVDAIVFELIALATNIDIEVQSKQVDVQVLEKAREHV